MSKHFTFCTSVSHCSLGPTGLDDCTVCCSIVSGYCNCVCMYLAYSEVTNTVYGLRPSLIACQTLIKTPTSFIWIIRGMWKRGEMTSDAWTPIQSWEPLWQRKRTEEKEPSGSREVQRKKSWRWEECWWGWGGDENWFIAALMRSGMPGDSGCSASHCFGKIKRNRGLPSCYNCCRHLSNGLKS